MKKIKYIHCLGTSYTAGAGFEFEIRPYSIDVYNNSTLDIKLTLENFSYPGQLQKLLADSIVVNNFGKNGFGDEKLIRDCYSITNDDSFNSDEHLFLLEFSGLGRKELYNNIKKDYFIFNYRAGWDDDDSTFSYNGGSFDYNKEESLPYIEDFENSYLNFFKQSFSIEETTYQLEKNNSMLLGYLENLKCNYLYTQAPSVCAKMETNEFRYNKIIGFGDGLNMKYNESFVRFGEINGLQITDETNNLIIDGHNGYICNKITAETIYNKLISSNYIDGEYVDIDYTNTDIFKKTII